MASNRLKLNPAKTDFMRCVTRRCQHQLSREALMFGGVTIQPSSTVCDLGIILNPELSLSPHINHLVSRCFHQFRSIKSSVRALPMEAAKTVVNSFVVSRVDYCNSPLASVPQYQLDRLQAVMNTAARLVPPTLASSPQAGPVQAVLTSLQAVHTTQSCSSVSRRLLPTGVLRRRQTETQIRGTRRSRHRQDLHEVRCSVIRCRSETGCRITSAPSSRSTPSKPH